MISFTIWQVFELLIGTVAIFLFLILLGFVLLSSIQDPDKGCGCSLLLLFPLVVIALILILSALL